MSPRKQVRTQPNRPADRIAPLPPSVIGRGTDRMSADGIDATYTDAPDTRYGIGSAGVAVERAVVFEEPLMAYLAEQEHPEGRRAMSEYEVPLRTHLSDLFTPADLAAAISGGYVREQQHPTLPLRILNYTERAQYERVWTDVTRRCRGLIVDAAGEVVARSFEKFFNFGEHPEGTFDLAARVAVTDKWDGSLGILYPTPDGHAVATRGSFTSEQAQHATKVWQERYAEETEVDWDITWLFEIIYPGNRIVCDYAAMDDLVLLGGVEIHTGRPIRPGFFVYDGPKTKTFAYDTLGEALAAQPRPGAEGLVVRFPDRDHLMIKLKQDDYVALHRIVTGLNARVVWESLGEGKTVADICEPLPDEFHAWVGEWAERLLGEAKSIEYVARTRHEVILSHLPEGWTRKDYAAVAARSEDRAWLFMLLDGKDPQAKIWRTLRPSGEDRPVNVSEDTA